MNNRACLAVCLLAVCVCTAHAAEQGTLVLDEGAYWRYYVQFGPDRLDPAALKAEGDALLGKRGILRLRKSVKRWVQLAAAGTPAADPADWRDHALFFVTQVANVGCNDERISFHTRTPPSGVG